MKRWKYEEVKNFIENNSSCKLLSKEYKNIDTKLKFKCSCGNEFETSFDKFKSRNKRQCNECGKKILANKQKLSYEEVKQFIEVDSNSGCKLLSKEYNNAQEKLLIQCACGNTYKTKWNHFKNSHQRQCPTCGIEMVASKKRLDNEYVKNYIEQFECKLLSKYKNTETKITIQCKCGNTFETLFSIFRDYDVHSCRICRENEKSISKGETKIEKWLIENNIKYKTQYTFEDCKHDKKLKFDFAILNNDNNVKMLIEFDGKQHFGVGLFSDDTEKMLEQYSKIKQSDETKNTYCFRKCIPLLRIPYSKYANIDKILSNSLL